MDNPIDDLLAVLSLDEHSNSTFTGPGSGHGEFGLFGGHQLAQAVIAAYRSVDAERRLNSLHAFFLRGGDGNQSVTYEVENIRDGRAFCQRRVNGIQNDKQIFDLTASFHTPESGSGEINPAWPQGVQPPESLPTFEECMEEVGPIFGEEWSEGARPVEYRIEHAPWAPNGPSEQGGINFWFRARQSLPDDPKTHAAILAYMSDDCVADTLLVPYGRTWGTEGTMLVSLDHSMWFHSDARVDDWIYVEQWPVAASGARGLAQPRKWQNEQLVVSVAQEALTRF
ncbi:MAG: thioesterase family protein [Acidimicrobiales bacterium]|nr:thioesterase family protein [Acidimicrobiales bacterium]